MVELKHLDGRAGIAPRFVEFLHDISQRRQSHRVRHITFQVNFPAKRLVAYQVFDRTVQVVRHAFHYRIALRMHGRVVQRIVRTGDAKETGALLKGFGTHARHVHQLLP